MIYKPYKTTQRPILHPPDKQLSHWGITKSLLTRQAHCHITELPHYFLCFFCILMSTMSSAHLRASVSVVPI